MQKIYIDESGNTGQDLLNSEQTVFVLASNNFSDIELETLSKLFENDKEIHFKKLKNNSIGQNSIIKFLNHELITEKNIICSTAHKEYATVGQIVDQLIEPVLYDIDVDIYRFGQNIAITNFIYVFGISFWDKELFKTVLNLFINMMRTKKETDIIDFYNSVNKLYKSLKPEYKQLLEPIIHSKKQINIILEGVNKFTIDLTLSSFYIICDKWYKKTNEKLNIIQDDSKQIEFFKSYIEFTKSLNLPKQEIGFGSRKMTFPTQIENLTLVNSEQNIGVQISDLIASSLTFMYNNDNPKYKTFVEQIQKSKLLQLNNYHTIWPNTESTPEELKMTDGSGMNVLDFLANERIKNGI